MNRNHSMMGLLIRKNRVAQNMSQEALCHGICSVSYLSKIENSTVMCSDEILSLLFDRLGLTFFSDPSALHDFSYRFEQYFEALTYWHLEKAAEIFDALLVHRKELLDSELVIDMMLAEALQRLIVEKEEPPWLHPLLDYEIYLNRRQSYWFYLLFGIYHMNLKLDYPQGLHYLMLAQRQNRDGMVLLMLTTLYYLSGDYFEAISQGEEAYLQLMKEGNLNQIYHICNLIAAAYANCKNIKKMQLYYQRMLSMLSVTGNPGQKFIAYYNMGATYLCSDDFQKSYAHLMEAYGLKDDRDLTCNGRLLLLQKLILCCFSLNKTDSVQVYLSEANRLIQSGEGIGCHPSVKVSFAWLAFMLETPDYLQQDAYLALIKATYDASLKDSHRGTHRFYGNYLVEAYKAQRKYKEALKITEDLYVKPIINTDQFS